uniref:SSD domain-containing protein n=1 Tax=Panagrolaimus sp. JU765 TaxID=591449 RepID=A0AC34RF93_9BILA
MALNPFGLLQDFLANCFYRYGLLVSRHPNAFIIGPILLTFFLSLGCLNIHVSDDLRFLYSPEDSLSRFEYQIHQNFSGDSVNSSLVAVALEAADGDSNMLRKEIADAVRSLDKFILHNMTIQVEGKTFHFGDDICSRLVLCPISNSPVEIFFDVFFSEKLKEDPRVKMEWPVMKFFENKFFLPTNLYGVELDDQNANLKRIELIHLVYHISAVDNYTSESVSEGFEKSLRETLEERKGLLKVALFSLNILKDEMQKNTTYTFPFISLTVFLLLSFTVGSCMTGDWITSKPIEALMGVFCSSLAIMSSAGLLFALGVPYISQVTVMPFIAFAIGVDDTYVMLGAWQDTKRNLAPEKRMALALEEAGSAITVTSLTSALSFGIGTEKLKEDPRVKMEWPVMKFFENKFFLPTNLYGVELDDQNANLKRIELIHLVYHISAVDNYTSESVSEGFEKALRETLEERKGLLKVALFSLNILKDEMQKNTTYTFPFISLTVFLLLSFTVGSW